MAADEGSPRDSEMAIDIEGMLEGDDLQPRGAVEWVAFTAAGDTPTYAKAMSPTHASPLRRPTSRGGRQLSFGTTSFGGSLRSCVRCGGAPATRWCSRAPREAPGSPADPRAATGSPSKKRVQASRCTSTEPRFCEGCVANACAGCGGLECDACAAAAPPRPQNASRHGTLSACDACARVNCAACYRECRVCHKAVCSACLAAKPYLFRADWSTCERCAYDADALDAEPCHSPFSLLP